MGERIPFAVQKSKNLFLDIIYFYKLEPALWWSSLVIRKNFSLGACLVQISQNFDLRLWPSEKISVRFSVIGKKSIKFEFFEAFFIDFKAC